MQFWLILIFLVVLGNLFVSLYVYTVILSLKRRPNKRPWYYDVLPGE